MIQATRKQWIRFALVALLYIAFLCWVKSWWGLLLLPLLFDAYITKKIPWTFWRQSNNLLVRTVMGWVDAIVFALVAVYFVNIYIFQNYQIPSSSLEKSLLVGDFLFVSKMSYGPRVPHTPLSMPLAQHTLPVFNTKSYIEWPQWGYKRVKGFGKVKLNDIVVFNFPAGDTVATLNQQEDIYALAYRLGQMTYTRSLEMDSLTQEQQIAVCNLYYQAGRQEIDKHPERYGEVVVRPVDRRENYVKRCVGLPGDTLQIVEGQVLLNGKAIDNPEGLQFSYLVQTQGMHIPEAIFRELGISLDDQIELNTSEWAPYLLEKGLDHYTDNGSLSPVYRLPLTVAMHTQLQANSKLIYRIVKEEDLFEQKVYPLTLHHHWTRSNYGPLWIPSKGSRIELTPTQIALYHRCIVAYEGNTLEVKPDGYYINGVKQTHYTFQMDYYWLMGDNRDNSLDSRYWGFVPEDHVVGKPILVWLSLDKDRGWFDGRIRWNRLFKWVH